MSTEKEITTEELVGMVAEADPDLREMLGSLCASYAMALLAESWNDQEHGLFRCIGILEAMKAGMLKRLESLAEEHEAR